MTTILMSAKPKGLVRFTVTLLALLVLTVSSAMPVQALSASQKKAIQSGALYVDTEDSVSCSALAQGNGPAGGSIYVIGDSITVGLRDSGSLAQKLSAATWQPYSPINAEGGEDLGWGLEQLEANSATLGTMGSILIALGTNNVGSVVPDDGSSTPTPGGKDNVKQLMQDMVNVVKAAKTDIRIYWTSIYMTGTLTTDYGTFDMDAAMPVLNEALNEIAAENGIAVLPWATSTEAPQYIDPDGLHYTNYPAMADYIVAALGNTGSGAPRPSGCVCRDADLTGSDAQQQVFNYFVSQGYTAEWAAGIVGNMMHESGVQPMRLQGTANGVETPSSSLTPEQLGDGDLGWGLVQWTPPGKMINPSYDEGRGTPHATIDTMIYQVGFLWRQLEGTAIAINEKRAGDELKRTTTPEDAAVAFGRYYERFGGSSDLSNPRYTSRKESARSVYDIYASTAPSVGSSVGCRPAAGTPTANADELESSTFFGTLPSRIIGEELL